MENITQLSHPHLPTTTCHHFHRRKSSTFDPEFHHFQLHPFLINFSHPLPPKNKLNVKTIGHVLIPISIPTHLPNSSSISSPPGPSGPRLLLGKRSVNVQAKTRPTMLCTAALMLLKAETRIRPPTWWGGTCLEPNWRAYGDMVTWHIIWLYIM